jgi:threonine synthase
MVNDIFYSTSSKDKEKTNFENALLMGLANDYGLFMFDKKDIPVFSKEELNNLKGKSYSEIALKILSPIIGQEFEDGDLKKILDDAYSEKIIPTNVDKVNDNTYIMWLTQGPTYSFKDYAARFFGRTLNYFLGKRNSRRIVVVATSGDTGGAVADALEGLDNVDNIIFFPKGSVSDGQRRQMTTLKNNIYAFEVNGDFDICQSLAKTILGDKDFALELFNDKEALTSANSISVGRLLPQAIYPFYAYSKIAEDKFIASIPSGNFGDMMGTVIARQMGLPVEKIICGVNENKEFPLFLETGEYNVFPSIKSPSSAMIVSHPSNLARLIDFYDGVMIDERDEITKKVIHSGLIVEQPNFEKMRQDIYSISISNQEHYSTMQEVFQENKIILDPHGSVGWCALKKFRLEKNDNLVAVIYETADPGKFPEDVKKAIDIFPSVPKRMKEQEKLVERIYSINSPSENTPSGLKITDKQIVEAKQKIKEIFSNI